MNVRIRRDTVKEWREKGLTLVGKGAYYQDALSTIIIFIIKKALITFDFEKG